jgi:hypothetical protein
MVDDGLWDDFEACIFAMWLLRYRKIIDGTGTP